MLNFLTNLTALQIFALCFFCLIIGLVAYLLLKRSGPFTTYSSAGFPLGKLLALVVLDAIFILYFFSWGTEFIFGGSILAKLILVYVLAMHILILFNHKDNKKMLKLVLWYIGVVAVILILVRMFAPEHFSAEAAAEEEHRIKSYKAYTGISYDEVSALQRADGRYQVEIPLSKRAVKIRNLFLRQDEHFIPVEMFADTSISYPGTLDSLRKGPLGAVKSYQVNGKPIYLSVQDIPGIRVWLHRNAGKYCTLNDESAYASVQLQLNGYWEWVRPGEYMPPTTYFQPIILGTNLPIDSPEMGHAAARGYYILVFDIKPSALVDASDFEPATEEVDSASK